MRFLTPLLFSILVPGFAFADEPCLADSVIAETVFVDPGTSTIEVRLYAVTRDSVGFYNLPISWVSPDSAIYPSHVSYHDVLLEWDETYDTTLYSPRFIRMVGWHDLGGEPNPPLITNYQRVRLWTIHFTIDSTASAQIVPIDTTYDPIHGSPIFGDTEGLYQCTPRFIPGAIFYGVTSEADEENQILPEEITILQNYPNPFNAFTTVEFSLPEETQVELSVYNILGQKVAVLFEAQKVAGNHTITWDAGDFPSGVYFARLQGGYYSKSIKLVLLK